MTTSTLPIWRKAAVSVAAFALMAGGLAACSGGDSGGESGSAGAEGSTEATGEGVDDGTELTMWTRAPLERQAKLAVEAYNGSHQNQVKLEIIPNDDVEGKVGAAVQSDALPDILAGDVVRVPFWANSGVFMDLTEQIDSLPNLADIATGHIEAGTVDGAKHTLPFVTDISVMAWNKDLYKEAGLDPEKGPQSMAEYVDHAKKIAALGKEGVSGTYTLGASGGGLTFSIFPMLWGDGVDAIAADGTSADLASDTAKVVYDGYRELVNTPNGMGAGAKEETGATWVAPFSEGKVGVLPMAYTSLTSMFEDNSFEVGVGALPGAEGKGSSTYLGGDAIGISKSTKNVAQAWNFMAWLMTEDAQQKVFADNNDTAANLKVLETGYENADERTKIANATIKDGRTPVAINFNEAFNAAGSPWQLLFQNAVWGDGKSVDADNDAITAILGQ